MKNKDKCPVCGEELQTCENCGKTGCPDNCDAGWSNEWWQDDLGLWLCPKCLAEAKEEYNKATDNGAKVCGTCSLFTDEDDEGCGLCEFHQESRGRKEYCEDRLAE